MDDFEPLMPGGKAHGRERLSRTGPGLVWPENRRFHRPRALPARSPPHPLQIDGARCGCWIVASTAWPQSAHFAVNSRRPGPQWPNPNRAAAITSSDARHPHDHRGGHDRGADRARHRHDLRAARRAQRSPVRRPVQGRRRHSHHPHPPRAGRRLPGARCRARDRAGRRPTPWCRDRACSTPRPRC